MTAARAPLLNAAQVAEQWGVDIKHVRRLTRSKVLPAINVAPEGAKRPTWRYSQRDLDAWLDQRRSA